MKYPGGNTSTLFCEQVGTVTSLFEQWNDCERTVVLYALLKRVPFSNLKFLQLSIEYNIAQNFNSQTKLHILESNSNNPIFLTKLLNAYKNFKCNEAQLAKNSIIYEPNNKINSQIYVENFGKYDKKEDILNDILTYLPLLKPGNDEAKAIFLSLIPCAVDDSVRQIIPMELVQQILSYLLIHPAISNEDRRSLSHWLRHLEDHMSLSFVSNKAPNYFIMPNESSSTSSSISTTQWQAIAPPTQQQKVPGKEKNQSWDIKNIQVSQDFCDEIPLKDFRKTIGKNIDFSPSTNTETNSKPNNIFDTSNEDHHVSFSKNGIEILDYDYDDYNKSNTQIAENGHDHLTVPNFHDNILKTRRSNSLTTTTTTTTHNIDTSSSSENLSNLLQKPRSFSLSIEFPRNSLNSTSSETRLDEYKPNFSKIAPCHIGMGNIGQWLKSLRLHKYIWLFNNITYEQMLDINETYLESVGVTKGARNKLILCIQKLKDRGKILDQYKKDLTSGQVSLNLILEDLLNMIITPMKPVEQFGKDDVAGLILQIIDLVAKLFTTKLITQNDEDSIANFLTILDRALNSEGFVAVVNSNLIKEYKFQISKIKLQFTPKHHYNKSSNNVGGINKPRWNAGNSKQHKANDKNGRKNSMFAINPSQHPYFQQHPDSARHSTNNSQINHNKSSSYPNFNLGSSNNCSKSKTIQQNLNNNSNYHRHSLNNLMTIPSSLTSVNSLGKQSTTINLNNKNIGINNKDKKNSKELSKRSCDIQYNNNGELLKSSIGDINSRLESLCLQMTEQAIN